MENHGKIGTKFIKYVWLSNLHHGFICHHHFFHVCKINQDFRTLTCWQKSLLSLTFAVTLCSVWLCFVLNLCCPCIHCCLYLLPWLCLCFVFCLLHLCQLLSPLTTVALSSLRLSSVMAWGCGISKVRLVRRVGLIRLNCRILKRRFASWVSGSWAWRSRKVFRSFKFDLNEDSLRLLYYGGDVS